MLTRPSFAALALALSLCGTASANTYSVGLNLTQAEFVVGVFADSLTFTAVGPNPVSINLFQIVSYGAGGSGRGGGYKPGIVRHISLSTAGVYDSSGALVGPLTGTSTALAGTFKLRPGTYTIRLTGTGIGTRGSGEYGVTVAQIQPPPPLPPPPGED